MVKSNNEGDETPTLNKRGSWKFAFEPIISVLKA